MSLYTRPAGLAFGVLTMIAPAVVAEVEIDWATIGNAGNLAAPDTGLGAVAEEFRMATTEVSNTQYAEFLNNVASNDEFGGDDPNLYTDGMAGPLGGIARAGSPGSYSYVVISGREQHPVNFVSFFDSMRFVNWLHNGQGSGDTETGVYDISTGMSITRNTDALYFLPDVDEWHKAAYYQPASEGGDTDDYWLYPTSSNIGPAAGTEANFNGSNGGTTPVGHFNPNFYGLFDMAGNVIEWNEAPSLNSTSIRGGAWDFPGFFMQSDFPPLNWTPSINGWGFRIASPIPGTSPITILAVSASLFTRRRRS